MYAILFFLKQTMAAKRFRNFLSEELLEQILVKTQCTKTILRCTIVCKSWCSLIKSSTFIKTQLSFRNKKYLLCNDGSYSLYSDSEPAEECCTLVFPDGVRDIDVHGCCDGVICYTVEENQDVVYLWNPIIRKLKAVPKIRKPSYLDEAIGFWFNAEENDYQVVRIGYTGEMSFVEVYSLSSNSWKMINETCPGALEIRDKNLLFAKGTLHWLAKQEQGWIIVSLDMNNAMFREKLISGPCSAAIKFYLTRVHGDSLAIFRCGWSRNALGIQQDGCIIEVYDKNLTLFSRNSYDDGSGITLLPVGFGNNGEALLIRVPAADKMRSYDFATKKFKDYGFFGQCPAFVRPYAKSLVLLNDSDVQTTIAPVSGDEII